MVVLLTVAACGDDDEPVRSIGSEPSETGTSDADAAAPATSTTGVLGDTLRIEEADHVFDLTVEDVTKGERFYEVELFMEAITPSSANDLQFQSFLIGDDGSAYDPTLLAPRGCDPPSVDLAAGRSIKACVPFKLPSGVTPIRLQYDVFIGEGPFEWDLGRINGPSGVSVVR